MDIPYSQLSEEVLGKIIEEFVLQEGTDYGLVETPLSTKIEQVRKQLLAGKAKVVFDPETESVMIVPVR